MLGLFQGETLGQFFINSSFEGTPGISQSPDSWQGYDIHSTPDTGPVPCDHYPASDGESYLILITRGEEHPQPGTSENVTTKMIQSLEPGKYYRLSIDLASRDDVGHFSWNKGFLAYTAPVNLRIFGSQGSAHRGELLEESQEISQQAWNNYSFYLIPHDTYPSLIFEVVPVQGTMVWGNLLLDHLRMEEIDELPLDVGDLIIPNVFTPNGDGFNDLLVIKGLRKGSALYVYDRTGKEVFYSTDYTHDWDGRDKKGEELPPGTYWYVLVPSHLNEVFKGFIYLKREP